MQDPEFVLSGPVVEWRGPAPYFFVRIDEEEAESIKFAAKGVEYWGQVPVTVRIDDVDFTTALFPKDGTYLLPLKVAVRRQLAANPGDVLALALSVVRR